MEQSGAVAHAERVLQEAGVPVVSTVLGKKHSHSAPTCYENNACELVDVPVAQVGLGVVPVECLQSHCHFRTMS